MRASLVGRDRVALHKDKVRTRKELSVALMKPTSRDDIGRLQSTYAALLHLDGHNGFVGQIEAFVAEVDVKAVLACGSDLRKNEFMSSKL